MKITSTHSIVNVKSEIKNQTLQNFDSQNGSELTVLAKELIDLRRAISDSSEMESKKAIAGKDLDDAIAAAEAGDRLAITAHLNNLGHWVLDFCKSIGANVASSYIKDALK